MSEILMAKKDDLDAHTGKRDNPHGVTKGQLGLDGAVVTNGGVLTLSAGPFRDRPAFGNRGAIYISVSTQQVFYDDGGAWLEIGRDPKKIGAGDLGFVPAAKDEEFRVTLEAVIALENRIKDGLAEITAARAELRVLVDLAVAKTKELNEVADRVTALEAAAPGA